MTRRTVTPATIDTLAAAIARHEAALAALRERVRRLEEPNVPATAPYVEAWQLRARLGLLGR